MKTAVTRGRLEWQRHALERMMERDISREVVTEVLISGEIVEDYPDDQPYPSVLILGWNRKKPIHVVAAFDPESEWCIVITAYRPDLEHFEPDYRTRRDKK